MVNPDMEYFAMTVAALIILAAVSCYAAYLRYRVIKRHRRIEDYIARNAAKRREYDDARIS